MPDYVSVVKASSLPSGQGLAVKVNNRYIAVFHYQGKYYAMDDVCTHSGASLAEGIVESDGVLCPLHHAKFEFKTGRAMSPPAEQDIVTYPVRINGEDIEIDTAASIT